MPMRQRPQVQEVLHQFSHIEKGGHPTTLPPIPTSDARTHELLTNIRALLRQTIDLLTLQMKGESIFMNDINTELQALKDAVTAETDQDAALAAAIDGAVSTMASGVAEIKALAQQLGTVANDPQMVRDLAAQLKAATETQASKLAALQAASGDLAGAVTANTTASIQGNGSIGGGEPIGGPTGTGTSTSTDEPGDTTSSAGPSDTSTTIDPTNNDIVGPTSQEDINEAATRSDSIL